MRLNFVVFLSVLLCNSNLSGILSVLTATASVNFGHYEQNESNSTVDVQNRNERTKLKLIDLNFDVLFLIFEHIDTLDMLSMVEICPKLTPIAATIFRGKYQKVEVADAFTTDIFKPQFEDKNNKSTRIRNYELILRTLQTFGHVIKHLKLDGMAIVFRERKLTIMQFINKYTSESLTTLKIHYIKEDALAQFTIPFENVRELSVKIDILGLEVNVLPLSQIFPKLKKLTMHIQVDLFVKNLDLSFIDCEFSQLEYVYLIIGKRVEQRRDQIVSFLGNNSQVQHFKFFSETPILSDNQIHELLPNINNTDPFH